MVFYSACKDARPVRLGEDTREFAWRSLLGDYGREALKTPYVELDPKDLEGLSKQQQYDRAILKIARECRIPLRPGELLCGSATLGAAISEIVPAYCEGKPLFEGVSHLTLGFAQALKKGVDAYESEVKVRLAQEGLTREQQQTLEGMLTVVQALRIWHSRYISALDEAIAHTRGEDRLRLCGIRDNLEQVPFGVPQNFYQAVQMVWFLFAFSRLCGNWPGIGRLDEMLGGYLQQDLHDGVLTWGEAREILAHFFIKGCEWVTQQECRSGDAQHYQNIVLCGVDENGGEVANSVSELVLEVLEELPISDFPVAVRVNEHTPQRILELIARNVRHGGGVVAVYNEELILKSLQDFGYSLRDARRFANDGCWEVQVPGETCFLYEPFDGYQIFQDEVLGLDGREWKGYTSFDALYEAYQQALGRRIQQFHQKADTMFLDDTPCSAIDLFIEGCIQKARSYHNRGARFTVYSPHIGGLPDVADAMVAIKTMVYEKKALTLSQYRDILLKNWEGAEALREQVRSLEYFGNDADAPDSLAARLLGDYITLTQQVPSREGVLRPAGASTFGRQIDWREKRHAHAHGYRQGDILASNLCPTPGTDIHGVTAVIKSHCKMPLNRLTCGTALDIKLTPAMVESDNAASLIPALIRGFNSLGGFFMQMDVIDNAVLLEAQKNPDQYRSLAVRVSGWSARFVTLSREWQDMIIQRTTQQEL